MKVVIETVAETGHGFTSGTHQICPSYQFGSSAKYADAETGLLYYGYRYYDAQRGRWIDRDPIDEIGGINLYVLVENDPLCKFDVLGAGPFSYRIKLTKDYLAVGDDDQAAGEARELYFQLYNFSFFGNKPLAREFLGRWLDKTGGTRQLSDKELKDLVADKDVKAWIGYVWKVNGPAGTGQVTDFKIDGAIAKPGTDYFYAMGFFKITYTGDYCVNGKYVTLSGQFKVNDLYDWQNPNGKFVIIAGDKIEDSYATLVEDHSMATPFFVEGEVQHKDKYKLLSNAPTNGSSGGYPTGR